MEQFTQYFSKIFSGSSRVNINPIGSRASFQIFGFDVMLDNNFNPWILEMNGNPGLQPIIGDNTEIQDNLLNSIIDLAYKNRLGEKLENNKKESNKFVQIV